MVHGVNLVLKISPPSISHNLCLEYLPFYMKQRNHTFPYAHFSHFCNNRMGWPQLSIVLVCQIMALTHIIHAQNSPQDFVEAHNVARAAVGVPPLVWDDKVAAYARQYANLRSKDCAMEHSLTPYGENLAAGSWEMSAKEAVEMWVDERKLYNVHSNSCDVGGECLHYTQVVWKDSARVGCGRAHCLDGWTFVTCNYDPPGNFIGERPF